MVNLLYEDWGQDIRGAVCLCACVCVGGGEDPIYWCIAVTNQCLWMDMKRIQQKKKKGGETDCKFLCIADI